MPGKWSKPEHAGAIREDGRNEGAYKMSKIEVLRTQHKRTMKQKQY